MLLKPWRRHMMKNARFMKIAGRLLKNGLLHSYRRRTGDPGLPAAVSLEITHACIARCIMCNIWKIPGSVPNLEMDEWLELLSSPLLAELRELDITGGEPFLRDDLPVLFDGICELSHQNLKHLKGVAVTTNGFLTRRILRQVKSVAAAFEKAGLELVMVCAMDAVGEVHNRIRNVNDGWNKLDRTIQGLVDIRKTHPNLVIGLKTTILPLNVDYLDAIADYADENELFTIISPCIITEGRYLNPDRAKDLAFDREDIHKMIRFYESDRFRWSYHGTRLAAFFRTGVMKKPCTCGFNYFFVRSNGDFYLCPLIDKKIGSVREKSVDELFFSAEARRLRKTIGRFPECRRCTEPGLERFSLPLEGFSYLAVMGKLGKNRFVALHQHMGLDKYVG
jgi:MoaA/NifB/PqqE/SkfB family radical SAM enzyme